MSDPSKSATPRTDYADKHGTSVTMRELARQLEAENTEMLQILREFVGFAYPVSKTINVRGHQWAGAYLDAALEKARAALARAK